MQRIGMRLRNGTPYHTPTLRKILTTTIRELRMAMGHNMAYAPGVLPVRIQVVVEEGRKRLQCSTDVAWPHTIRLRTPRLTGTEFIPLLRQQYSGGVSSSTTIANAAHGALESREVARAVQVAICPSTFFRVGLNASVRAALLRAKVPQYVPLRVRKPQKETGPRDVVTERYEHALGLEAKWKTKLKLTQTKLKKLGQKRRYYEKKLANRNTHQEKQ